MLSEPTVFVIGAGAHVPYGFPTGVGLKEDILSISVDELPWERRNPAYRQVVQHQLDRFKQDFANSGEPSIDAFLENRKDYLEIGKFCIAAKIISYEASNRIEDYVKTKGRGQDWLGWFISQFLRTTKLEDFGKNPISFITFNYDRFLEDTLFRSLRAKHAAGESEVAAVLKQIPIVHVHGQIGRLRWQEEKTASYYLPMGSDVDERSVVGAAKCIQIVNESSEQSEQLATANQLLADAKCILFLGFGYLRENLRKLKFPFGDKSKWIDGTAYDATPAQRLNWRNQLFQRGESADAFPGNSTWDCLKFLQNCSRLLSQNKLLSDD